jgi:hypothetical protein
VVVPLTFPEDSICLVLGNNGTLDVHSLAVRLRFLQSSIVTLQLACVATPDCEVLRADDCGQKLLPPRQSRGASLDRLETAGVEFLDENGGGPGVRLRKRQLKKG